MGKIIAAAQCLGTLCREEEDLLVCLFGEERSPFYRHRRRRREAVPGAEGNEGDETNRQQPKGAAFVFNSAAGGGGGARVDVPLVLMLIQVGKEPPL